MKRKLNKKGIIAIIIMAFIILFALFLITINVVYFSKLKPVTKKMPSWLDVQYNETGEIGKTTVNVERLA